MNNNKNLSREAEIIKKKNAPNGDSKTEKYNIWNRKIDCGLSHKKNEILQFATTWMDLEGIMLSEISQTEKDKYCMISSLICGI